MLTRRIAIVGGGLSGLHAAALLERHGVEDYVLLEGKGEFGGRILSLPGMPASDAVGRHDLGATWFWPALQPNVLQLVNELGLEVFEQHELGDMLLDRSRSSLPTRVNGHETTPAALRIEGGMGALVDASRRRLVADRLRAGARVTRLRLGDGCVEVEVDAQGAGQFAYRVEHVLLAMPPRLAASTVTFTPALPDELNHAWLSCATWMAPHAKYVAVFDEPFWRKQGLSGEARSSVGPMAEVHDASSKKGGALFGFLGVSSQQRSKMPQDALIAHCRAQMVRLFGEQASAPKAEFLKDWASDAFTTVPADLNPYGQHPVNPSPMAGHGPWQGRLIGIGSEWSSDFSGYVAGAIGAAKSGVDLLLRSKT